MTVKEANNLQIYNKIDHRYEDGRFRLATIYNKSGTNLKIHYNNLCKTYDIWSNFKTEIYRFANPYSISKRKSYALTQLKKRNYIHINPTRKHPGWKYGQIKQIDYTSGQIKVIYTHNNERYSYWIHVDNTKELADKQHICNIIISGFIKNVSAMLFVSNIIIDSIAQFCGEYLYESIIFKPLINIRSIGTFFQSITINIINNCKNATHHRISYKCQHEKRWNITQRHSSGPYGMKQFQHRIKELIPGARYFVSVETIHKDYVTSSSILKFKTRQLHMTLNDVYILKVGDHIDYRDDSGRFEPVIILKKDNTNLKIRNINYCNEDAIWSDIKIELNRFAWWGAISNRDSSHRFNKLLINDYIDINPTLRQEHLGWKCGIIQMFDEKSGQVQIMYKYNNKCYLYWTHLDNKYEIRQFKYNLNELIVDGNIRIFCNKKK
eukprot:177448_1